MATLKELLKLDSKQTNFLKRGSSRQCYPVFMLNVVPGRLSLIAVCAVVLPLSDCCTRAANIRETFTTENRRFLDFC